MIDKQFFKKHQKLVLRIINTKIGRWLFGVEKLGHRAEGKVIERVTPNSIRTIERTFQKKGKYYVEYKEQFFSHNNYAVNLGKILFWLPTKKTELGLVLRPAYQLALIAFFGLIFKPIGLGFLLTTTTFNPVAGANSPVDGNASNQTTDANKNTAWSNCQGAASGNAANATSSLSPVFSRHQTVGPNTTNISRLYYVFDTSSLTSGATISAATFSIYPEGVTNQTSDGLNYVSLITITPASDANITTSDFGNVGTTKQAADLSLGSASAFSYNDWVLNATGLGNISKTGTTKFGLREGHDITNTVMPDDTFNRLDDTHMADNGANIPKLVVTYTVVATDSMFFEFMGPQPQQ